MGFWDRLRGKPTRDDFAQMIIKAMRAKGEARPIHYEPQGFKLRIGDEPAAVAWLANGYEEYLRTPRRLRSEILRRYAIGPAPSPESDRLEDILPRLLPRVRDRFFYTAMPLRLEIEGIAGPRGGLFRPIAEHLALGLVQDLPDHIIEVPESAFSQWGIPFEEAMTIARQNLQTISQEPFERVRSGVYVSPWRDNHDAARLTLVDPLRRLLVRGDPVAMVAHRDTLIITGTDDIAGLDAMAAMTESVMETPRAITCIPVCLLDDDTWVPFVPEPDHPLYPRYTALRVATLNSEYLRQKQLLDALHEKREESVVVASYQARVNDEGDDVVTYCALQPGKPTLLPRTGHVLFVEPDAPEDAEMLCCPWEHVAEVLGDALEAVETYPPRYRVEAFPDAERLAALKKGVAE
ncbi:hypothetical protein [Chondromyces crocatus]|uniref:DUF1444 domain-containing protein n=1 Tax=Chondromyces crocatus TaxID=52 RepID=A0A0K1ECX9_CHOCO|nr:hypothetical protein [Chondromyces crocatus]AKT38726.1 uncharacterized protein CMC5_028700 [Chondromyces crocatus]